MPPSPRPDAGTTLVEVLLAAGLLASAIVALTTLAALAVQAHHASGDLTSAAVFAQDKLQELRAPAGALPVPDGMVRLEYLNAAGSLVPGADAAVYSRRWRAAPLPGATPGAALLWVEVTRTVTIRQRVPVTMVAIRRPAP